MLLGLVILGCGGRPAEPVGDPAAAPAAAVVSPAGGCVAQDPKSWSACAGQPVTLSATRQRQVPSAPMLNGPTQQQDYFEVAGQSLIVLSAAPIGCDAAELAGSLRLHDLGGPEGTPMSWKGWVIDTSAVTCK